MGQPQHVVAAVAQRRHQQRHDRQAEEQVFAEAAFRDLHAQVAIGGGHETQVGLDRRGAADALEFVRLEHAQHLRLQ